ncbi:hypothetical protein [uncultured Williamsia sp.]|uniref:hypothetical protein n=1 Tax=uncultured Williamsia sp. TaxID=259311 RepID=UPI00260DD95C|nr:hypothetical protein [uncultured Williamsia sp.]
MNRRDALRALPVGIVLAFLLALAFGDGFGGAAQLYARIALAVIVAAVLAWLGYVYWALHRGR